MAFIPDTNTAFEANEHIICLLCRDSPGACNDVLILHTPFNQSYWDCHVGGKYHIKFHAKHIACQACGMDLILGNRLLQKASAPPMVKVNPYAKSNIIKTRAPMP